ncbi:MAG TPA: Crp/Fnr family transcriptional regulator [Conexibacter sp.]
MTVEEHIVRLLELDPELAERIPADQREQARRVALARTATLPRGRLTPALLSNSRGAVHGMLLLDGLVSRNVHLSGATTIQLLGAGDLLEPAALPLDTTLVPVDVTWAVLEPATAALLDDDFILTVRRWPELIVALFERVGAQTARSGTHCAISQLPRVEDRVEALLWLLAERWGRVGPYGIVLPLKLTHATLGLMLGAKRPTVSLAVKRLEESGRLVRRGDGAWLLKEAWAPPEQSPRQAAKIRFVGDAQRSDRWEGVEGAGDLPHPLNSTTSHELKARVERMKGVHARARDEYRETLDHAVSARERSAALRNRVRDGRR